MIHDPTIRRTIKRVRERTAEEARKRANEAEGRVYKIVRFRFKGRNRTIKRGLTLEEAQAHCQNPKTRGADWFDGYTKEE